MKDIRIDFGNKLKETRLDCGFSQAQLSERTKIGRENISKIENGNYNITINTIARISSALKVEPKALFDFSNSKIILEEAFIAPHPFVKWAGGKNQLLPILTDYVPKDFNSYFEPFIGGGALFFSLYPKKAYINDLNTDLICAFNCFKNKSKFEELKKALNTHEENHSEEYYYSVRELDRTESFKTLPDAERAARMIYLNKACFNGLYRVNSKGFFNVPSGKKEKVKTFENANFNSIFNYFSNNEINILNTDFQKVTAKADKNDFVYFDPPYDTLEDQNNFTAYDKEGFGKKEQIKLCETFKALDKKGVKVLLSNHNTPFINELYKAFDINIIQANRMINSKATGRGKVEEVLIKNY